MLPLYHEPADGFWDVGPSMTTQDSLLVDGNEDVVLGPLRRQQQTMAALDQPGKLELVALSPRRQRPLVGLVQTWEILVVLNAPRIV